MTGPRPSMQSIEQVDPRSYPAEAEAYFAYYGLDFGRDAVHLFGSFESGGIPLAAHLYRPARYEATVIGLHGYLNHSGQLRHLIGSLLEAGYAVAVFDLPGHGLSGGPTARIDDFEQYITALDDFMKIVRPRLHGPYHAVGFSTGAAILIDLPLTGRDNPFEKIVLAAPLIRWTAYEQSRKTYKIYSRFTDKITRFHQKNSSDKEYLVFSKTRDYLHADHLSLSWVRALFDWNEKLTVLPACQKPVLILQGDKDSTVDWRYNLDLLGEKFPRGEVQLIAGARHELFNESMEYRQLVLQSVKTYLEP